VYLPCPTDLLRQRIQCANQRLSLMDGAVVFGQKGAVVAVFLHRGKPQHR
jgi:hypothetical protein